MKTLFFASTVILMFSFAAQAQDLYFTILDSINYNPRSLYVADFDGDSLDELFIGTDTGLVVVDPRTHQPLWNSSMLREPMTASAFFDINGDGYKEIMVATQQNGYWLNIIYGPDYTEVYRWGGYISQAINSIIGGIAPDTSNIILRSASLLISINTQSWDYNEVSGAFVDNIVGNYIARMHYYLTLLGPPGYWTLREVLRFFNSDLNIIAEIQLYSIMNGGPIPVYEYGTKKGIFLNNRTGRYVCIAGCPQNKVNFYCFNEQFQLLQNAADTTTIPEPQAYWLLAADLDSNGIDDIYTFTIYSGHVVIKLYRGSDFVRTATLDQNLPAFTSPVQAHISSSESVDVVYYGAGKIYIAELTAQPVSIDADGGELPGTFSLSTYPNPFNGNMQIGFNSAKASNISVAAYNILGQHLNTIFSGRIEAGVNTWNWNAGDISSGIYFIVVNGCDFTTSKKVMLLK